MINRLLPLAGAALLSAASLTLAHASPASDGWVSEAKSLLDARVASAGLADDGRTVVVRLKVTGDPSRNAVRIVTPSGSLDFDAAAKAVVETARFKRPPTELVGRSITFTLGQPASGPSTAGAQ